MDRLSRIISIMIDLINHKTVNTSYLSNKYEVSIRTIYRDIELLDLSGIPIVTKRGKNGGFAILEGFKIDKSLVSENEFSIILRGLQALVNNEDSQAQAIYDKLISILENSKKEQIIKQSNNIIIDISPFEMQKEVQQYYKQIQDAIKENRCIKIKYCSIDNGNSQRIIEPLILIYKTANWYLYAFCKEKQDYRYFKLLRIKDVEVLEEQYKEREIEISKFDHFFSELEEVEIKLKTDKEFSLFLQENYYITKIEENKKEIEVTMQYPLNSWVYSTILSFGSRVRVTEPESIKNKLKEIIEKMSKLY